MLKPVHPLLKSITQSGVLSECMASTSPGAAPASRRTSQGQGPQERRRPSASCFSRVFTMPWGIISDLEPLQMVQGFGFWLGSPCSESNANQLKAFFPVLNTIAHPKKNHFLSDAL